MYSQMTLLKVDLQLVPLYYVVLIYVLGRTQNPSLKIASFFPMFTADFFVEQHVLNISQL